MLKRENIVEFFSKGATTQYQAHEVKLLLFRIRAYVSRHIYLFMWLSERLVPDILAGKSANKTFESIFDSTFRESNDFERMTNRILPRVDVDVFRMLFTLNPPASAMKDLRRYGFCDQDNKVISQLLFDAYALSLRGTTPFQGRLEHGVVGVQQLLTFALPSINWEPYNAHGGPIEDAMTFELLLILSRVAHLGTRLFNPKLVNVAAGRKPDLYLNTSVDAYVEAVLTTSNCASERKKLDEHISRFWEKYDDASKHAPPPYYEVAKSDFAVLNYQSFGTAPLLPFDPHFQGDIFNKRVFTFLMTSKEVYLGSTRIGGP